jgi:4-hydroxy-4-methyl-2-oxoglutarate aldolase
MIEKIIDFIKRNRVSTSEVSDCLGKTGHVDGLFPVNSKHFCVGRVKWTIAYASSNWPVHLDVQDAEEGDIVFIDVWDCEDRAIVGELVTKYLLLYKQVSAIVCNGKMRDASALLRENYEVWCSGFSPIGCFNEQPEGVLDQEIYESQKSKYDNSIAVCDDSGVVIIPSEMHTDQFYDRLVAIESQEDVWFDRLDKNKESTFDIVCLKKYLNE